MAPGWGRWRLKSDGLGDVFLCGDPSWKAHEFPALLSEIGPSEGSQGTLGL